MESETDLPPGSPAESMRLIEAERAAAGRVLYGHPLLYYGPWGAAWLLGFGLLFLRFGPDDRVFLATPAALPIVALFVLLAAALATSTILAGRAHRHIRGRSSFQGMLYGFAWAIGFTSLGITTGYFADLLPVDQGGLLWGTVMVGAVGLLHMAGAAIWRDLSMFGLGVWLTVINTAGVFAGPGWHSLIVAVAGGGGMLVVGTVLWLARPSPAPAAA